jgi:hypothetical protein
MLSVSYEIHAAKGMEMGFNARMLIQKQGDGTVVFAGNLSRIGCRGRLQCGLLQVLNWDCAGFDRPQCGLLQEK